MIWFFTQIAQKYYTSEMCLMWFESLKSCLRQFALKLSKKQLEKLFFKSSLCFLSGQMINMHLVTAKLIIWQAGPQCAIQLQSAPYVHPLNASFLSDVNAKMRHSRYTDLLIMR